MALADAGNASLADQARRRARHAQERFERTGRLHDALYTAACAAAAEGNYATTLSRLDQLLASAPGSHVGWTLPIEPLFRPLHGLPGFATMLDRLADHAK